MSEVKVWFGGEGSDELGSAAWPGVLELLLRRVRDRGWVRAGQTKWSELRKLRVGSALRESAQNADSRNTQKLILLAAEKGCSVVAFTRDTDGRQETQDAIEEGICLARDLPLPSYPQIVGGAAKPCIEGWIVALAGVPKTDEMSKQRAQDECAKRVPEKRDWVQLIEEASLPASAPSLDLWLRRASEAFDALVDS